MADFGLNLLKENFDAAIAGFMLNVEFHPGSWNAYHSLAEGFMKRGDRERAIVFYRKYVELNPDNQSGKDALRVLGAGKIESREELGLAASRVACS